MTITQFLTLFPLVKQTRKGWDVQCPAHDDKNPSLGVIEGQDGRIVFKCLAACSQESILDALGLTWKDVFPDTPLEGTLRPTKLPPMKVSKRALAWTYELHALDLRLQADKIFEAMHRCGTCETWTDTERDMALNAVAVAYAYQDRATFCEDYADHVREVDYVTR